MTHETFFDRLASGVPETGDMLREHLDAFDVLLPYVLLFEIVEWADDPVRCTDAKAEALVRILNEVYPTADTDLQDMIDIQLLEYLPRTSRLVPFLGPELRRNFEEYRAASEM